MFYVMKRLKFSILIISLLLILTSCVVVSDPSEPKKKPLKKREVVELRVNPEPAKPRR